MRSREFLAFLVAGGIAAAANFGSRILFSEVMAFAPAIVLAYCVGMLTAFVLNRLFVFRNSSNTLSRQALWFVAVNAAAVVQTLVISLLLRDWLLPMAGVDLHREAIAHAVGVVVPVITSYLGHKHLTFRTSPP